MERRREKKNRMYNTNAVDEQIGIGKENYAYDKVDVFIERINKKIGWVVFTHLDYIDNKVEEQKTITNFYSPYDLEELLSCFFIREKVVHYVDYPSIHIVEHDEKKEKNHMDIVYIEYVSGKPIQNSIRVPKREKKEFLDYMLDYRKNDPSINSRFDGYSRDPIVPPKRIPRREMRIEREAHSMPMPEPKVKLRMIGVIEDLARCLKDYVLIRLSLNNKANDLRPPEELHYRRR